MQLPCLFYFELKQEKKGFGFTFNVTVNTNNVLPLVASSVIKRAGEA